MRNAQQPPWYELTNIDQLDSPALVVYPERIRENIQRLKSIVPDLNRLRPHVKTHKMAEVTRMLREAGITKFKCATIAEAEMLAAEGAKDVLLAYQPVGPKMIRLLQLTNSFPDTQFSCLVDNRETAERLASLFCKEGETIPVWLDLNVGMNRTGIAPGKEALDVYLHCRCLPGIEMIGLHAYDGHIRDSHFTQRKAKSDAAFAPVQTMADQITELTGTPPQLVVGGSPTFPVHALRTGVECSPGTFVFWDWGYKSTLPEQPFDFAALVITRVVSVIDKETFTLDLGHKSIAAENPHPRVIFLNYKELTPVSQSEEHLVVKIAQPGPLPKVGDVLYGVPFHICPTCALYERAWVAENGEITGSWRVISRDRTITI